MRKPFLPTKWWEWAAIPLLLLPILAIFMPVDAYSGPARLRHFMVARDIAMGYRLSHRWPKSVADLPVRRTRDRGRYGIRLERTLSHSAIYRIEVRDVSQVWRVDESGKAGKLFVE